MDFDNFSSFTSKMFPIKACSVAITKSKYVVLFSLGKFEAVVGKQKLQMTHFVSFKSIGFCFLNFCLQKKVELFVAGKVYLSQPSLERINDKF